MAVRDDVSSDAAAGWLVLGGLADGGGEGGAGGEGGEGGEDGRGDSDDGRVAPEGRKPTSSSTRA